MNAQELKSAFNEAFKAKRHATSRGTELSARAVELLAQEAWAAHMAAVVCGKIDESPATGGVEPAYSEKLTYDSSGFGSIRPHKNGIRVSESLEEGRPGSNQEAREADKQFWAQTLVGCASATEARGDLASWVVVELPSGQAVMTIQEAYALGAREMQSRPA